MEVPQYIEEKVPQHIEELQFIEDPQCIEVPHYIEDPQYIEVPQYIKQTLILYSKNHLGDIKKIPNFGLKSPDRFSCRQN